MGGIDFLNPHIFNRTCIVIEYNKDVSISNKQMGVEYWIYEYLLTSIQ